MRILAVSIVAMLLLVGCATDDETNGATTMPRSPSMTTTSVAEKPIDAIAATTSTTTTTSPATAPEAGPGESISITETITITVKDAGQP